MTEVSSVIKKYLFYLFCDSKLSTGIHLDGGAALYFFYKINRTFSNDLDFTADTNSRLNNFINNSLLPMQMSNFGGSNRKVESTFDDNKITILENGSQIFHIDIFYVPAKYCRYQKMKLNIKGKSIYVSTHSLDDIFIEKLFCTITRTEERDLIDLSQLVLKTDLDPREIILLFSLKSKVKNSHLKTLKQYLSSIPMIEPKFSVKFPNGRIAIKNRFNMLRRFIEQQIVTKIE